MSLEHGVGLGLALALLAYLIHALIDVERYGA